jgi:bifunctional DNA-binding transcriptional regulator/antitoxin component of YhaV-PrlF toxin-antitoxin module
MLSKVTSKLQLTLPTAIAEHYGIRPGDTVEWAPAGDVIRILPSGRPRHPRLRSVEERVKLFDQATERQGRREARLPRRKPGRTDLDCGWKREDLTRVAALVDTNILVYRFDPTNPRKRDIARAAAPPQRHSSALAERGA